jgi:dTDP-4-dehydrorhamnose 3,5-epimerase
MKIEKFPNVKISQKEVFRDARGSFQRICSSGDFNVENQNGKILEVSFSFNPNYNTLRGLHAMPENTGEIKSVSCVRGRILDVIVDTREGSKTLLDYMAFVLDADNVNSVIIPPGFAHGYLTLTENTSIVYAMSANFNSELEFGLRWDDPAINIDWGTARPEFISARDQSFKFVE